MLREVARDWPASVVNCRMAFWGRMAVWLFIGGFFVGCARHESPEARAKKGPVLRKVSLQSDWFPQGEHGGFYQALAKGFYRESGLDVDILPGGPGAGISLKVSR